MMTREQLLKYEQSLHKFMRMVKGITTTGAVLSMILYGLALNSYFNHQLYSAVILATIAFIAFHLLRRYVVSITCYIFRRLGDYHEMLDFIEQSLADKEQRTFFLLLEKALTTIQK